VQFRSSSILAVLVMACAGGTAPRPSVDPVRDGPAPQIPPEPGTPSADSSLPPLKEPIAPYALAHARGWMALASTGVPEFLAANPAWDGRGVLIGILDGGVDVGAAGLESTSTGTPKVIDLRDFSGEGRIRLTSLTPRGDSVRLGDAVLGGFGRVRALDADGPWFGGVLNERLLGVPPASDVNGNGRSDDRLALVVVRASDGWVVFADTDGDGSLTGERGVRDYLAGRETIGWRHRGRPSPLAVAVNVSGTGAPVLDLFFDTGGHGTHVAGIAAGRGIGGVSGFNGVAPGAQLLGLKIARNDFGGITTSGSVIRAIDYAIRTARARGLPLVLNMSYGVGNEREGAARLDVLIDSILAANPEVLFVTSAGNDGPGLSTIGFPGTVQRGLSVGATYPGVFIPPDARGRTAPDVLAFFSSRGGEVAKPDLVAPGYAFSVVPRWERGEEFKGGTSMAAPHVAGLAAILISGAVQSHRLVSPADIRRALISSGRPVGAATPLDQGSGQPWLSAAWAALKAPAPRGEYRIEAASGAGQTAVLRIRSGADRDSMVRVGLRREPADAPVTLNLTSSVPWLRVPDTFRMTGPSADLALIERLPPTAEPGAHIAQVEGREAGLEDVRFRVIVTVVVPTPAVRRVVQETARVAGGGVQRLFFVADSGRPFHLAVETAAPADSVLVFLHSPGGSPVPGIDGLPAGANAAQGSIAMDGRSVRGGLYEAVSAAAPNAMVTSRITVEHAPVVPTLRARRGDTLEALLAARSDSAVSGSVSADLVGGERSWQTGGSGSADVSIPFTLPAWAGKVVIDLLMPSERWPDFTDFGLALRGSDGRILGKQPLNYARGRLAIEVPPGETEAEVQIVLAPGFAEEIASARWSGELTVRLYAPDAAALAPVGGTAFRLGPQEIGATRFIARPAPWLLPDGFLPLVRLSAVVGGSSWTNEHSLLP
jgi:subtilisin family serine protease